MRRNLLMITCFFCLGIVVNRYCPLHLAVWLVLAGAAFFVNLGLLFSRGRIHPAVFLLCVVLAGSFWHGLSRYPENIYQDMAGRAVEGEGTILSYPRTGEYNTAFTVGVLRLAADGKEMPGLEKLLIKVRSNRFTAYPGNRISFRGELVLPGESRNPGEFNYREYLAHQGVFYEIRCSPDDLIVSEAKRSIRTLAARGREKVAGELDRTLPATEKWLLLGLLFGDISGIPAEEWEGYERAGVLHLFAVSGFNVAFVLGIVWFFISFVSPAPLWRLLWGIPALLGYFLLVGWTASIVRASLMALLGLFALLLGRRKDIYTGLALAALVIMIVSPGELFLASFQLSFTATAGIVYLAPHLEKLGWGKVFSAAAAAHLATLPLMALCFNQVSLVAPFLNILAATVSGFATVIALTGCLLVWTVVSLAEPLFVTAGSMMYYMSRMILLAAWPSWAAWSVTSPPVPVVLVYYVLLIFIPYYPRFRPLLNSIPVNYKFLAGLFLLLTLIVSYWPQPGRMEVVFLDVGQGDSIFLKTPGGRTALLDGGGTPESAYPVASNVVRPYLRRRGLDKVDMMIMSHPHLDHSEGLLEILPYVSTGVFFWADAGINPEGTKPGEAGDAIGMELRRLCQEKRIAVRELSAGQRINLDGQVYIDVLHPASGDKTAGNNHSLVLQVVYKDVKWLLTGDIEQEAIAAIVSRHQALGSDVLKLPHHGSISSYSPEFYERVNPRAVVASVGFNVFNQPHPEVAGYFQERGIPFFTTVENGAVTTFSDGSRIWVRTMQ